MIHLKRAKELKALNLTREEIAVEALRICEHAIKVGSYKNAVAAIGRMRTLSNAISDSYWKEKRDMGADRQYYDLLNKNAELREVQ